MLCPFFSSQVPLETSLTIEYPSHSKAFLDLGIALGLRRFEGLGFGVQGLDFEGLRFTGLETLRSKTSDL